MLIFKRILFLYFYSPKFQYNLIKMSNIYKKSFFEKIFPKVFQENASKDNNNKGKNVIMD